MTRVSQNRISVFLAVGFAVSLLLVEIVDGASLYWTDERGIHRSDLDGQNRQTIVPVEITIASMGGSIASMAIDEVDDKIYYADRANIQILRSDLDGGNPESVITSGLSGPSSVVLDSRRRKLYWMDWFKIYRSNLDGTDIELLVQSWEMYRLALDEKAGKIYWLSFLPKNPPALAQANLDGSEVKQIIVWDNGDLHNIIPKIHPRAFAIDADAQKIYFIWDRAIQRANTDGSDIEVVLQLERDHHNDNIAVDGKSGQLFWTDSQANVFYRANLDGSNVEIFVQQDKVGTMTLAPLGKKIYWTNGGTDSTVHRANVNGSQHEAFQATPPRYFRGIDVDERRGKIYVTSRNWALSGAKGEILRVNRDGTAVESLIAEGLKQPTAIAVDEIGEKIYWVHATEMKISRANLDGSDTEDLIIDGKPRDIEVDGESGRMYWIDVLEGIRRAKLDGTEVEILIGDLKNIHGIEVDPIAEKIYWAQDKGFENTIRTANLDGRNLETLVTADADSWWRDMELDSINQKIFWVDRRRGLIQRANLDGTGVETVVSDLEKPKHIALDLTPESVVSVEAQGRAFMVWGQIRQNRLLQNFPNPFNPETWIPYQLAEAAEVTMKIYDTNGLMVRELVFGHQPAGIYQSRSRAAYWDGRNKHGESVVSGIYFCTLTTGDFATTQKMLINK